MEDENNILKTLTKVLEEDPKNYTKILELSSQLAKFDNENIRFTVDAGVIDRLGSELVARQETAVSELVKNAYDADATEVILKFENSDSLNGILTISDNGIGMTKNQLVNGFMRISSTDKIHNPVSDRFKRKKAGQKGIGRFAVQRLGNKLVIITQTKEEDYALKLVIEWNQYKSDIDLINISNKVEIVPKEKEEGTILRIEQLKDSWSYASIRRIYRYVVAIMQPFPLKKNSIKEKEKGDIFTTIFKKVEQNGKEIVVADEKNMIYDQATAVIEGWIDERGLGLYTIESKKLKINEVGHVGSDPDDYSVQFDKLKHVRFRAYYFIYGVDLIPKMHETSIREFIKKSGSIHLYRNGFRVLPYGELGNDWLKLDNSTRQRSILPVHGNINFSGFVEIEDKENIFSETSSREGLIENASLIQLVNFVYRVLITGVLKVAEVRNVKAVSGQKQENGVYEKIEVRIKDVVHTLEALEKEFEKELDQTNSISRQKRKKNIKKIKDTLIEINNLRKKEQDEFLKERSMLRVLSSVGITIGQFIHEVKDYLVYMKSDINYLLRNLESDQVLLNRVFMLQKNLTSFETYTSYFDAVISQNVRRELKPIELQNFIEEFWKTIQPDAEKSGITFNEPIRNGYYLYTLPMHPSEWSSILFNFYTNAKKAIKRTKKKGEIRIECGIEKNHIYLEFSDTGDGISKENEDKIFNEFFTTSSPQTIENIDTNTNIVGTGLGLKIVKDIVSSYRGKIEVVNAKEYFNTCFRIEILKATNQELDNYGV